MKSEELSEFLGYAIQAKKPVLIVGQPGTGKSDIVAQSAAKAGADMVLMHGVTSDPTDVKGMPFVVAGLDGKAKADFTPFGDLLKLIEADKLTVCFLDDLGQAPPLVQASYMQMVQARQIGEHKISSHVVFIAATNRKGDQAAVTGILEPVKSRFTIVTLEPDVDSWCKWALAAQLPVEVIAFCRFKPEFITAFNPSKDLTNSPSPRTMKAAADWVAMGLPGSIKSKGAKGGYTGMEFDALQGCIGEGPASELCGFLQIWRSLPSIDSILLDPEHAPIPRDQPATLYALAGLVSRRSEPGNFDTLVKYINRMDKDFGVMSVKMAVQRNPEIATTAGFTKWAIANSDVTV